MVIPQRKASSGANYKEESESDLDDNKTASNEGQPRSYKGLNKLRKHIRKIRSNRRTSQSYKLNLSKLRVLPAECWGGHRCVMTPLDDQSPYQYISLCDNDCGSRFNAITYLNGVRKSEYVRIPFLNGVYEDFFDKKGHLKSYSNEALINANEDCYDGTGLIDAPVQPINMLPVSSVHTEQFEKPSSSCAGNQIEGLAKDGEFSQASSFTFKSIDDGQGVIKPKAIFCQGATVTPETCYNKQTLNDSSDQLDNSLSPALASKDKIFHDDTKDIFMSKNGGIGVKRSLPALVAEEKPNSNCSSFHSMRESKREVQVELTSVAGAERHAAPVPSCFNTYSSNNSSGICKTSLMLMNSDNNLIITILISSRN